MLHSYARAVEMFAAGALGADRMVSHAYALEDYGEALEMFRAGTGRKLQIGPRPRIRASWCERPDRAVDHLHHSRSSAGL